MILPGIVLEVGQSDNRAASQLFASFGRGFELRGTWRFPPTSWKNFENSFTVVVSSAEIANSKSVGNVALSRGSPPRRAPSGDRR